MKKILALVLTLCLAFVCFAGLSGCNLTGGDKADGVTVYVPDGATAIAMSYMMSEHKEVAGQKINYRVALADSVRVAAGKGEADMAVLPANAAHTLYKTGIDYKIAAVITHGNLFVLGKNIESIDDLNGKTVGCFGEQQIPGLVFRYLLKEYGVSPNKVEYSAAGTDVSHLIAGGKYGCGVVAEPEATSGVNAMQSMGVTKALDLQQLWREKMGDGYEYQGYAQAVLLVKNTLSDEFVQEFLAAYKQGDDEDALTGGHEGGWAAKNPADCVKAIKKNVYGGIESTIQALSFEQIKDCNAYVLSLEDGLKDYVDRCLGELGITVDEGFYRTFNE